MPISRRALLGSGAAALASSVLANPFRKEDFPQEVEAKNIIFMVADGMAVQVPSILDQYLRYEHGRHSYWHWLMNQEWAVNGLEETSSLSSVVTDSAAGSCSWSTGRHIWNGQVNQYPDGTKLTPITKVMSDAGIKCGLVTTTRITHATPAGFGSCVFSRDMEDEIAADYLNNGVDILLGGGARHFDPARRQDKADLFKTYADKGYTLVKDRQSILDLEAGKILGTFWNSHLPYTLDWENNAQTRAQVPTLAEMTRTAINNLKKNEKGFLLQVEGGRVDHAGHANDFGGMIFDQMAFEDAVKVAVEFARQDGNTLVVITTDHATGGISLNGAGDEYFDSTAGLKSLSKMKASYEMITPQLNDANASKVKDVIKETLDYELSTAEAQGIVDGLSGDSPFGLSNFYGSSGTTLATILGNHSKVTWTSSNHTSEHCLVTAVGPGAGFFHGVKQNISFYDHILALKGLKFSNPSMSYEEAFEAMQKAKANGQIIASIHHD